MPPPSGNTENVDVKLPSGETVTATVPQGMSDADIHTLLQQKHPEFFSNISAQPAWNTWAGLKSRMYEAADVGTKSLPAAGAMIGAAIGGGVATLPSAGIPTPLSWAGAVGGAGMGGMAGEAAKQIIRDALGFENPNTASQQAAAIAKEGAIQGGTQAITEGLPYAAGPIRNLAEAQYVRALAPTTNINKALAQKIAPEALESGVHGSLTGIAEQASQKATDLAPKLDQAINDIPNDELAVLLKKYESPAVPLGTTQEISAGLAQKRAQQQVGSMASTIPGGVFKPNPIVEEVGTQAGALPAEQLFGPKSGTGFELGVIPGPTHGALKQTYSALEDLKQGYIVDGKIANPTAVNAIQGVQDIVSQYGDSVSPQSLRKLRQIFDDPVAKAGGFMGNDLAGRYTLQAQEAAGNSIRGILAEASPDVAKLNHEISFWLNVERVASASAQRQAGQAGGLVKVFTPLAAAGTGLATGYQLGSHAGLESAGAVVLTGLATKVVRSAAWRTASAVVKNDFANALASGNVSRVAALATRFGVAAAGLGGSDSQGGPQTAQGQ